MPRPNHCEVCGEPTERWVAMCRACQASYDRTAHDEGSVMEAIHWAARRARWYAGRRAAKNARISVGRDQTKADLTPEPCECHGDPYCEDDK